MKVKKRVISALVSSAVVLSALCSPVLIDNDAFPSLITTASAASVSSSVQFINASNILKQVSKYKTVKSSTTSFSGGYYVASGKVTVNDRIYVTSDTSLILKSGCVLTAKHGIDVAPGVKFNIYTQDGRSGKLFAGTTNGSNSTGSNYQTGIGGKDATINIIGGNIFAVGGPNAYGIQGSTIRLYNTNRDDSVKASSYSSNVHVCDTFVDNKNHAAYSSSLVSAGALKNALLEAADAITENTNNITSGNYAVFGTKILSERLYVSGNVSLYLADGAKFCAYDGIDVSDSNILNIYGNGGVLYAGTKTGSDRSQSCIGSYRSGIGSKDSDNCGDIIINSGIIYANGGYHAAAIGGNNAYVNIRGGKIIANGGEYAAAIGGCYKSNGCEVRITGGDVRANSGTSGNGIGSGSNGSKSYISIGLDNYNDRIFSTSYSGIITFLNSVYTSDNYIANSYNIANKTLRANLSGSRTYDDYDQVTVSFDLNYTDYNYYNQYAPVLNTVSVRRGMSITLPRPERYGYIFDGWYTDRACTSRFYDNSAVYNTMTLYAKWISANYYDNYYDYYDYYHYYPYYYPDYYSDYYQNYYYYPDYYDYYYNNYYNNNYYQRNYYNVVAFETNGGTKLGSRTVNYGETLGSFPYVSKTGYVFDGWYIDPDFRYRFSESTPIYSDITLYAKWVESSSVNTCLVTFNAGYGIFNDGTSVKTVTVKQGTSAYNYLPVEPNYSTYYHYYDFAGWYYDPDYSMAYNNEPIYRSLTLYAKYNLRY